VLEKTLKSLSDCMEIKPVNQKGDEPPDGKSRLIGRDPDAGED